MNNKENKKSGQKVLKDNQYITELVLVEKYARDNFIPVILRPMANFLCELIIKNQPKKILEIGTAIGYSGVLMLKNSPAAILTTVEIDEKRINIAEENFKKFAVADRVTIIKQDAIEVLKSMTSQKENYDFIFLDGPKGQYIKYLPLLKSILSKNGILVADDINFLGKVFSDEYPIHKHRTFVINLRKFVKEISDDKDFETAIYPIGESVIVARKLK